MTDFCIYASTVARTKAAFGIGIPPHRFRDSAVTTLSEDSPNEIWIAPILLHHADQRIAERHYNQAKDASAVRDWQEYVATRRRAVSRGSGRAETS